MSKPGMVFKLVHTGRSGKNIFEVEEADKKTSCFLLSPLLRVNKSICDVIYEMSAGCVCVGGGVRETVNTNHPPVSASSQLRYNSLF